MHEDYRRWFDSISDEIRNINFSYTFEFDSMINSNNSNNSDSMSNLNDSLHWYPGEPPCPPLYYVLLQGVFAPMIIIVSTILNSVTAVVLLQKHLRSPTNILLLAIALYDTLTGLFPFPVYIFVFTFNKCEDYMPYAYGWFHRINHDLLPFIFHTCSIWITVVLAIQRYIYVCHSEKAKRWCTVRMALKAIAFVNILALILASPMFFEGKFHAKPVRSKIDPSNVFQACAVHDYTKHPKYKTFFSIYSVVRALLINVGPCTILVILNAILVQRMKEAKQNRDKLMRRKSYEARSQEQANVTLMLVIVVTIFLIVEIPMAFYLILTAILTAFELAFLTTFLQFAVQLLNFAVLLSYPINFFIYCRMSRSFRDAFTQLLCPNYNASRQDRLQTVQTPLINKTITLPATNNEQIELKIASTTDPKSTSTTPVIVNKENAETSSNLKIPDGEFRENDLSKETVTKGRVSFGDEVNRTFSTDL